MAGSQAGVRLHGSQAECVCTGAKQGVFQPKWSACLMRAILVVLVLVDPPLNSVLFQNVFVWEVHPNLMQVRVVEFDCRWL
jgi:hypothetical protein